MMKKKLGFILPLLLVGNASHSVAQSMQEGKKVEDLSVRLDEVVVTGTGTEHYLKDAPVQTEASPGRRWNNSRHAAWKSC